MASQNRTTAYSTLFRTSSETLRMIAADPEHPGAGIGLIAVQHGRGQTLSYHLHCLVPGDGPLSDSTRRTTCNPSSKSGLRSATHAISGSRKRLSPHCAMTGWTRPG